MAIIKGNQNTTLLLNYLKSSTKQYKLLNKEEERKMIEEHKDNREELNKLLFMHNIRLVFSLAKHYMSKVDDFDTLVQDGMLGLAEAARRFEIDRDVKFCTYCVPWIKKFLLLHFYGKQVELDKLTVSMNAPGPNAEEGDNGQDSTFENVIGNYIDPTCIKQKPIEAELSSIEQREICDNLYARVEADNSLSATDKAVFIELFQQHEKSKDLADKYHIAVEDVMEIKHKILGKLKDVLKTEMNIQSFQEIG